MAFKLKVVGFEQLTSLSSAVGLTAATYKNANLAIIECDHTANKYVRWRDDGTSPTATVGMTLAPGAQVEYDGDLSAIKLIEESASAKVNVTYYFTGQ
jgi:hypothetical protein